MLKLPWNFCRWVVDRDGKVQQYLNPTIQLHTCFELVEYLLNESNRKQIRPSFTMKPEEREDMLIKNQQMLQNILL